MNQEPHNEKSRKVVIVGGGLIGLSCAHYLSLRGDQIVVIDRGEIGKGCSHGNCGYLSPSHVLPLTEPGAVKSALKSFFQKNPPFKMKFRFDLALWKWFWQFSRRCNHRDMIQGGEAIQPLLRSSARLYEELLNSPGMNCEWEQRGLMFVFQSSKAMEQYAKVDKLLTEHFQEPAVRYDGDALSHLEPALKTGLAGGWHYEEDAHLRSDRLVSSWRNQLQSAGVTFIEHCAMTGFRSQSSHSNRAGSSQKIVSAIQTEQEEIQGDHFVMATGAWTPLWNRELECKIPVQPGKGYSMTMPRPSCCPVIPMLFPEHRVGVTPMQSGYRLGSIMEFAGYDESIRPERLKLLREGTAHYLKEPECEPIEETWFGWRPMTPDSIPIISALPRFENVHLAVGHNMLGLSMAPATGKLIAELIHSETPHLNAARYSITRF